MNFFKTLNIGSMAKNITESILSSGATAALNYKIGEHGIDGVTAVSMDISNGMVTFDLEGENRNTEVVFNDLVYVEHEMGIRIIAMNIHIRSEHTGVRKVWLESIVNKAIETHIENNDGMWINHHTKKILTLLKSTSYATMA